VIDICKAFSCIIDRKGKVYWEFAKDSHDEIGLKLKDYDKEIDDKNKMLFAKVEISPKNGDYLNPDEWILKVDERIKPTWFTKRYEESCFKGFRKWKKEVYSKINLKEARRPIHPFKIRPHKIDDSVINLLKEWASVWASVKDSVGASVRDSVEDSVGASVRDSVGDSVKDSVGASVWASVWASVEDSVGASVRDSVGASVRDSVWAYIGSFFRLKRSQWEYTEKIKTKGYPFESCVKLWEMGLVPSFDGRIWRLHGKPNGKILFEISKDSLEDEK
jgi:hypothetical protein